ncbi:hypothetical protein MHU86_16406 [Fragilaria crotonensis]|nr:hypothetical protein MHU86_16406 [Fragilaria crotonensis]
MNHILLGGFVGRTPDAPLQACGAEELVPVKERILSLGVKLRDNSLAKVLEFDFRIHELRHVFLESLCAEGDFSRERMISESACEQAHGIAPWCQSRTSYGPPSEAGRLPSESGSGPKGYRDR